VAYVLGHMMEGVIDRGTAASAAGLDVDLAGKTGTTDEYSDAWFIGFTPRYTILTWVGYDQKRTIGRNMTGAEAALPSWRMIVEHGLERGWITKGERFVAPPGVARVEIEYTSGLRAVPGAPRVIEEAFVEGTQPERLWEPKWAGIMALPWFQQRAFYIPREGERMPEQITDWALVQDAWEEKAKGN
jgi:penicillin-binding protein 1A